MAFSGGANELRCKRYHFALEDALPSCCGKEQSLKPVKYLKIGDKCVFLRVLRYLF